MTSILVLGTPFPLCYAPLGFSPMGVWPAMEPRSVFRPKVATPNKGRDVWDFTYNPESGWLWRWAQACSFVFVRTTEPTLKHMVFCQSGNQKKRAWRHVTQEEVSTSCKMRKSHMEAELHGLVVGESVRKSDDTIFFRLDVDCRALPW